MRSRSHTDLMAPLRIDGLNALRRALKEAGDGAEKELRPALNEAAQVIVNVARPHVPVKSGRAKASLRVSSTGTKVRVTAGGTKAPYFPWLDYGGKVGPHGSIVRPFIKSGRIIYPAYGAQRENILRLLDKRLTALIESKGLDVT